MKILGISAFYHDSAAALVCDGKIVAAAQEERFNRKKHYAGFPRQAIESCLTLGGTSLDDIDFIAFYDKPFPKFERLFETYVAFAPRGFRSFKTALPIWLKEKLFLRSRLTKDLTALGGKQPLVNRLLFAEHHQSHAASAFFPSPFARAAVLTMDGVGEWTTSSIAVGQGRNLDILKEIHFPHSLGLLYSAFTYYTGFRVNSGEYKVMGLAPYGEPRYTGQIYEHLIDLKDDGSFRLNLEHFDYCTGLTMTNRSFDALFGGAPRDPDEPLLQRHMDLAASIQAVTEDVVLKIGRSIAKETGEKNLCMAGGVALNCVANGKLLRDGAFENIWVQPASGDAGGAVGAALAAYHTHLAGDRETPTGRDGMSATFLGPSFAQNDIEKRLSAEGAVFDVLPETAFIDAVAKAIADGKAVGWFQGRMEFGPRALGARSILADARDVTTQKTLNLKVKFRESFRPFAPACLAEDVSDWFELDRDSPYMMFVADVKPSRRSPVADAGLAGIDKLNVPRSHIPAVTHVDYSARIQTVSAADNPLFHALISRFKDLTGCPVVVNTSFNVRGEPIVYTPEDAFRCFMGTDIDVLAIGNCLLLKERQSAALKTSYHASFAPD